VRPASPAGGPVFDFHARLVPGPDAVGRLLRTMDAVGIARAAVCAGGVIGLDRLSKQIVEGGGTDAVPDNDAVRRAGAASDRLVPFYFANPRRGPGRYRRASPDFRGLEISPAVHGVGFTDPRVLALVEVAAAAGHPVYAVCVATAGARTADFLDLARRFPGTTFVFGHCGFTGIDIDAINRIEPHANIVVETSGCFGVTVRAALDRLGPERVLFGTEYPLQHPAVELTKLDCLDLHPSTWASVAWANAHRVLREETP
jgi:uncharacterized protein